MKKKLVIILMSAFLAVNAFADYESEIRDLKMQKEKLNSEIQTLNAKISATDSMLRADVSRHKVLEQRYKADSERRRAEIDTLNSKIRKAAASLQQERNKQARAKNRSENVSAKRRALRLELAKISKKLESQIAQTLPWERDSRLDRAKSLTREIESGNASEEEQRRGRKRDGRRGKKGQARALFRLKTGAGKGSLPRTN